MPASVVPRIPGRGAVFAAALVLALLVVGGCGGSDAPLETESGPVVFLSPSEVSVAPGTSIETQVDIADLPSGDGSSGYSISLSETATRIAIESAPCPAGVGTASCRRWTITPAADSMPGEYGIEVRAAGTRTPVRSGQAMVRVLAPRVALPAVLAASRSHLVTNDGRLWGSGPNLDGQAGIGFTSAGFDPNVPIVLPEEVARYAYLQIGTDTDWRSVVTGSRTAIALKRDGPADTDGTVWGWGANPEVRVTATEGDIPFGSYFHFGFASEAGRQLVPRRIPDLTHVVAISAHNEFALNGETDRFWALRKDGTVWAWGGVPGPRYDMATSDTANLYAASDRPLAVLQAVSEDRVETPLNDVIAIAGGTRNTGRGWGVAIRGDGSVWQVGSESDFASFIVILGGTNGRGTTAGTAMARPVSGLSGRTVAVAVGRSGNTKSFSLALTEDGQVWGWTEAAPTAQRVGGLANIVAIDARGQEYPGAPASADSGDATAIDGAGRVWTWKFAATEPSPVASLPPMARTALRAPELVLTGNCPSQNGGVLWNSDGKRVPNFFGNCPFGGLLKVSLGRIGEGTVTTEPGGHVTCGAGCTTGVDVDVVPGEAIVVRATAAPGWRHVGFNPQCSGGRPSRSENTSCIARFEPDTRQGRLAITLSGPGQVTSSPAGIDCGADCQEIYPLGTTVTLSAVAAPGYRFARWRGATYLNETDCRDGTITINVVGIAADNPRKHCIAVFEPLPVLTIAGSANGRVTSAPAGIDCGATCAASFPANAAVTLTATAAAGYRFDGFREAACGLPLRLSLDAVCTPVFTSTVSARLTVSLVGDGRVTSGDGSVDCVRAGETTSGTCSHDYPVGTALTLTSIAGAGRTLSAWSSDCVGGSVTLDRARVCTATFVPVGWQQVGPALAAAGTKGMAIAVDLSVPLVPRTYAATAEQLGVGKVNLIVRRYEPATQGWVLVGGGPANADELVSRFVFTPAIAVDAAGTVSVAWAADEDRIRVKQLSSDGATWITLADNLEVDPAARVFGTQIATAGSHLLVAWIEGTGNSNTIGRMAVKRYVPTAPAAQRWSGGLIRATTETSITALRLNSEAPGNALLMAVPFSSAAGFLSEGPLLALRQAADGSWGDVCAGSLTTPPGSASVPNGRFGFGIARNTVAGTAGPVAVFNNGDAVFARACRNGLWVGLDGSAAGQVAVVTPGGQVLGLALASGEGSGVALAWSEVVFRNGGGFDSTARVLVANPLGTAMAQSTALGFDPNLNVAQGGLSLAFLSDVSPTLAAVLGNTQSTNVEARVFRLAP